jgi:4-hydroxy-tetrahydrodipicolinate reductase
MLRIALIGAGRMGKAIMLEMAASKDLQLAGLCVRDGGIDDARRIAGEAGLPQSLRIVSDITELAGQADVIIDFSLPDASLSVLKASVDARRPLVSGVTGLDAAILAAFHKASQTIPLLYDRNMSVGVAVLQKLLQIAGASLGGDFAAGISETHHRHKVDAPSGTAIKLGEALAKSRGQNFADVYFYDPDNSRGKPSTSDIVFRARRLGENPGEHAITFSNELESLELKHTVASRQVFAHGALRAARWLADREPGFYSVADITH